MSKREISVGILIPFDKTHENGKEEALKKLQDEIAKCPDCSVCCNCGNYCDSGWEFTMSCSDKEYRIKLSELKPMDVKCECGNEDHYLVMFHPIDEHVEIERKN